MIKTRRVDGTAPNRIGKYPVGKQIRLRGSRRRRPTWLKDLATRATAGKQIRYKINRVHRRARDNKSLAFVEPPYKTDGKNRTVYTLWIKSLGPTRRLRERLPCFLGVGGFFVYDRGEWRYVC